MRERSFYQTEGYVKVASPYPDDLIQSALARASELVKAAGDATSPLPGRFANILRADRSAAPAPSGDLALHREHLFREEPAFRALVTAATTRHLLAHAEMRQPVLLDDQLYYKPSSVGGATYLHRDSDFFGNLQLVTVWVALTPAGEDSSCLRLHPKSHVRGDEEFGIARRIDPPGGDWDAERAFDFFYEIRDQSENLISVPCGVGDVLLLHRRVLHGAYANRSERSRLSYVMEFIEQDDILKYEKEYDGVFTYHDRKAHMVALGAHT